MPSCHGDLGVGPAPGRAFLRGLLWAPGPASVDGKLGLRGRGLGTKVAEPGGPRCRNPRLWGRPACQPPAGSLLSGASLQPALPREVCVGCCSFPATSGSICSLLEAGSSWLLPRDPHSSFEPGSPLTPSLWCPGSGVCGPACPLCASCLYFLAVTGVDRRVAERGRRVSLSHLGCPVPENMGISIACEEETGCWGRCWLQGLRICSAQEAQGVQGELG